MTEYNSKLFKKGTMVTNMTGMPINKDFASMSEKYGFDTQEEYIENDYGPEKIKRGRWRIVYEELNENCHSLWHQCDKEDWGMSEVDYSNWSDLADREMIPGWRCRDCGASPPETIVGLWCLMEPDWTSEMVQHVINNPDREEEDDILREWGMIAANGGWNKTVEDLYISKGSI